MTTPEPATLLRGIGTSIAAHRRAVNITQVDLAARIGKSVQWISAVEQGRRHANRLTDLLRIATVLRCNLEDLIGRPIDSLIPGVHPHKDHVADIRTVLLRSPVPISSSTEPSSISADIITRVAEAWTIWHTSSTAHTILGGFLPALLTDAMAVYHSAQDRRAAARALSGAYQITRQWLHHIPNGELAWIAADRAINIAREADDPHLIALGAWALSGSYRRAGHQDEATRICLAAADELKPLLGELSSQPNLFAAYGMLHLAASISAAQSDEDGRAWALHQVANDTAR
ncbi:MAG: helix-turn-helix domain-containing protein, partial [Pseudonocardiaceae bacterium]